MSYAYDSSAYDNSYSTHRGGAGGDYSYANGGGGFLPTTDVSSSSSAGGAGGTATRLKRDPQSLLPVTVKQLHSAVWAHDKFVVDGRDVMQVTVVAQVRAIAPMATNVQYTLNDGTGEIVCRVYIEDGGSSLRGEAAVNAYVRIIGALKQFPSGERGLQGYHVLPITDCNEITYHQIEAVHTHLKHTAKLGAGIAASISKADVPMSSSQSYMQHDAGRGGAAGGVIGGGGGPGGLGAIIEPGLSAQHNAVLAAFYHNSSEQGAAVSEVAALTGLSPQIVQRLVVELSEDGHLYSTVDEEHYKSTRE